MIETFNVLLLPSELQEGGFTCLYDSGSEFRLPQVKIEKLYIIGNDLNLFGHEGQSIMIEEDDIEISLIEGLVLMIKADSKIQMLALEYGLEVWALIDQPEDEQDQPQEEEQPPQQQPPQQQEGSSTNMFEVSYQEITNLVRNSQYKIVFNDNGTNLIVEYLYDMGDAIIFRDQEMNKMQVNLSDFKKTWNLYKFNLSNY